jgi:uridine kinase
MKFNNNLQLKIKETWYNKTIVQEDGVTQLVDTEHLYPLYQLEIFKDYFNADNKEEAIRNIISDLKETTRQLEGLLERTEEAELDPPDNDCR